MECRPESHAERIYANLLDGLQTGAFAADHRFVDTEVAAQYGASRMPAREALLRLVAEGYLTGSTRGFVIPTLSLGEIGELSEVRRLLEPRAAASAAGNMDPAVRADLDAAIGRIRDALENDDLVGLMRANVVFRNIWLAAVGNRTLAATIARFMDRFTPIRRGTFEDARYRASYVAGLESIHAAFMEGDALHASDAMTRFMFDAEAAFRAVRAHELDTVRTPPRATRTRPEKEGRPS
ncbi:GntR family transcriptional regulator [Pararhizobium mangrovi]|uniref:GntR family transcriptional regulator n=1 Tax=Pararhizobium mangrovi TaxID=2590452 RepID=A0A506UEN4_9HYPH|nr:GntR family transcriptional regulator [Pararhizobium mangrovi]TPW30197.1 GntR family transcriptional regulator [Pararhizobium mangrovi]